MAKTQDNKQIALDFLNMVVAGKIDEAYSKYVDMKGNHHNSYFPAGFESLKNAMKESHNEFPNKKFRTKFAVAENDMAAVYSNVVLKEEPGIAVVHMFRFENGKIAEMWDVGQVLSKESPNKDGAF